MTEHANEATHTIWREGARIRATNGTGYADFVTDDDIRGHIANPSVLGGAEMVAFAEAVLAIRKYERLVVDRRLRAAVGASPIPAPLGERTA